MRLERNQLLVAAHDGFCVVAPSILGRALPSDATPFGQDVNGGRIGVPVAAEPKVRFSKTVNVNSLKSLNSA